MQTHWILVCLALVFFNIELSVGEPKRSFGFGRSRPKSNSNLSVRRRGHSDPPKSPQPTSQKQHTAHTAQAAPAPASAPAPSAPKINGPPPAYSVGPSAGKTPLNAAPPAYSGVNANYPRQSYSGVNSGTNMHQPNQGYGWNTQNSYGGSHYGGHPQPPPSYGNSMGGYGGMQGGYGGMPSHGGYGGGMMSGGMMGGGMMGGGMMGGGMGGGMMGGVQPIYVQQRSSSMLPSIAGGAITGLAAYQLARAFGGGSNHHHSEQHIYHHHENPPQSGPAPVSVPNQDVPQAPQAPQAPQSPQSPQSPDAPQGSHHTLQTSHQMMDTGHQTSQTSYGVPVAQVPLAPFPSETNCTENCSTETSIAASSVPEIEPEFPFPEIHPSLFRYAVPPQNKELEYWAKSVNRKLNLTAPDTDNSTTASP